MLHGEAEIKRAEKASWKDGAHTNKLFDWLEMVSDNRKHFQKVFELKWLRVQIDRYPNFAIRIGIYTNKRPVYFGFSVDDPLL